MQTTFLSYQPSDVSGIAGRIADRLAQHFGAGSVIKDVFYTNTSGIPYSTIIAQIMARTSVFVIIIGPHWLASETGGLQNQLDPVRIEIELALQMGKQIIPLLVEDAQMPSPAQLPPSIAPITQFNASVVRYDPDFDHDMRRLFTAIEQARVAAYPVPTAVQSHQQQLPPVAIPQAGYIVPVPGALYITPEVNAKRPPNRVRRWIIAIIISVTVISVLGCALVLNLLGGGRQSLSTFPNLTSIQMLSSTEGWAVGGPEYAFTGSKKLTQTLIYHFVNGKWQSVSNNFQSTIKSLSFSSATEGWAVGSGAIDINNINAKNPPILHYHSGTWTTYSIPVTANTNSILFDQPQLNSVAALSNGEAWAVGDFGAVYHEVNGEWIAVKIATTQQLTGIAMVSPTEGWVIGAKGNLFHLVNGTLNPVEIPLGADLKSISMLSANEGWIATNAKQLLHYQNGTWSVVPINLTYAGCSAITAISTNNGWLSCELHIFHLVNGAWQEQTSNLLFTTFTSFSILPNGDAWGCSYAGIYHFISGQWTQVTLN